MLQDDCCSNISSQWAPVAAELISWLFLYDTVTDFFTKVKSIFLHGAHVSVDERTCLSAGVRATQGNAENLKQVELTVTTNDQELAINALLKFTWK